MKRPLTSAVLVALVVAATHTDARACKRLGPITHEVDAAMQATDHTPPTLPGIPRAQLHYGEGSQAGCGSDCPDVGFISIPADATDDMTAAGKIGYRYTLAAGELPPGLTLPATAVERNGSDAVVLDWDSTTGRPVDFTLQVVAIDLAGNESAPQTVLVRDSSGNACSVAHGRRPGYAVAWIAIGALALAARRRPRRRTLTWIQCARRWTGLSASEAPSASSSSA